MLAAEEENIESVKERSMDEGMSRPFVNLDSLLRSHGPLGTVRGLGDGRAGSTCLLCFNVTR
jgi:hypothetical protein